MPLPIKTAVHAQDGHAVRAVLVTASFTTADVDNLVGTPVNAVVRTTTSPPPYTVRYTDVTFWTPGANHAGAVEHNAGTTVPGYLLWDGGALRTVTPRVFAQEYTVAGRENPEPRPSTYHG